MESFKINKQKNFADVNINETFVFLHDVQEPIVFLFQKISSDSYQGIKILKNTTKKQPNPRKIKGYIYKEALIAVAFNENQNLREILAT